MTCKNCGSEDMDVNVVYNGMEDRDNVEIKCKDCRIVAMTLGIYDLEDVVKWALARGLWHQE